MQYSYAKIVIIFECKNKKMKKSMFLRVFIPNFAHIIYNNTYKSISL